MKKKKQSVDMDSKTNQMLELADVDFKAVTINKYKNVKENGYSKWKTEKSQQGYRNYKRQKFEASKVNIWKRKIYYMVLAEDWRLQKKDAADCIFQEWLHHPSHMLFIQHNINRSPIKWWTLWFHLLELGHNFVICLNQKSTAEVTLSDF